MRFFKNIAVVILFLSTILNSRLLEAATIAEFVTPKRGITFVEFTLSAFDGSGKKVVGDRIRDQIILPMIAVYAMGQRNFLSGKSHDFSVPLADIRSIINDHNIGIASVDQEVADMAAHGENSFIKRAMEACVYSVLNDIKDFSHAEKFVAYLSLLKTLFELPYWLTLRNAAESQNDILKNLGGLKFLASALNDIFKGHNPTIVAFAKNFNSQFEQEFSSGSTGVLYEKFKMDVLEKVKRIIKYYWVHLREIYRGDQREYALNQMRNGIIQNFGEVLMAIDFIDLNEHLALSYSTEDRLLRCSVPDKFIPGEMLVLQDN